MSLSTAPLPVVLQPVNFVQSNDLIHRATLDVLGWSTPVYLAARNPDERRERVVELSLATFFGFVLVPLVAKGLTHVYAKQLPHQNPLFFHLTWPQLDSPQEAKAFLKAELQRTELQRNRPPWLMRQIGWLNTYTQQRLDLKATRFKQALHSISNDPACLKQVSHAKKMVLLRNIFISTLALSCVTPLKQLVTRLFSHKDRFTGSENYLSDKDSKRLSDHNSRQKLKPLKVLIHTLLVLAPVALAWGTHHGIEQAKKLGKPVPKLLVDFRNYLDYSNGIYLSLGGLFTIFMALNFNDLNWARDRYELQEIFTKYSICVPSFWFGDRIFNGNIAKITDALLSRAGVFKPHTFIVQKASSSADRVRHTFMQQTKHFLEKIGPEAKSIQHVYDEVLATNGEAKAKQASALASAVFVAGVASHSLAMAAVLHLSNALTKHLVTQDLSNLKDAPTSETSRQGLRQK